MTNVHVQTFIVHVHTSTCIGKLHEKGRSPCFLEPQEALGRAWELDTEVRN